MSLNIEMHIQGHINGSKGLNSHKQRPQEQSYHRSRQVPFIPLNTMNDVEQAEFISLY